MRNNYLLAYKRMAGIRIAQQELVKFYLEKKVFSMVHFYIGQEAVAVGVCDNLIPEDKVLGNHRSHGHYLARGGDLRRMVCELLGKKDGLAHGKGGSMHMIDRSVNFVGSTPILGSVVPIASGVAFEKKYRRKKGIAAAFLGDGAFEEGVVYETINLATLYEVPLLLVVENNMLSITTKIKDRRSKHYDAERIVTGLGARYARADGNDYQDVFKKAKSAIRFVRAANRPAVLECKVYRHMAHSTPLFDEKYREEDTLKKRTEQDSVRRMRLSLLRKGVSEKELTEIERKARQEILAAIDFAQKAEYPSRRDLYSEKYA